ncbi:small subunit ribosomal protein S2 [Lewinella marina]|uniref:Small ribosomal subunit protein uS2 n=1 Tax=Neolewinella marina TaxID=438751 RepID=A0A2G0CGM8_9BACT|nr:30S ribosomal protein S2 [Neolewinella marina]NJB86460.1 small subunit ribosomal protein S2 [Neolewinella marina]PHK99080.1 30S ribosomal protein S2 [Neolewinella marina]
MAKPTHQQLLDAGVHFGHLRRKWNPKMSPYIFTEKNGIHLIDLNRTLESIDRAGNAMRQIARAGKKILFVATKKQARDIVTAAAQEVNMPYVTDRWQGGMLTNFNTIRRSIRKMQNIDRMLNDGTLDSVTKKERLTLTREHEKMNKVLGGIADMQRIPNAIFVVDIVHEHLAIAEAKKLGMRTFGIVDTNADPTSVDYAIPGNDDASKAVGVITNYLVECIKEGLAERSEEKEEKASSGEEQAASAE